MKGRARAQPAGEEPGGGGCLRRLPSRCSAAKSGANRATPSVSPGSAARGRGDCGGVQSATGGNVPKGSCAACRGSAREGAEARACAGRGMGLCWCAMRSGARWKSANAKAEQRAVPTATHLVCGEVESAARERRARHACVSFFGGARVRGSQGWRRIPGRAVRRANPGGVCVCVRALDVNRVVRVRARARCVCVRCGARLSWREGSCQGELVQRKERQRAGAGVCVRGLSPGERGGAARACVRGVGAVRCLRFAWLVSFRYRSAAGGGGSSGGAI